MSGEPMTSQQRRELAQVTRDYARSAKARAEAHAAQLALACAEELCRVYEANDKRWAEAVAIAKLEVEKANERIQEAFAEQGLRNVRRVPYLTTDWRERGETLGKERRAELEKVANAQAKLIVKAGIARAEELAEEFRRRALIEGWSWQQAVEMVGELLGPVQQLMPPLDPKELHRLARQEHVARHRYYGQWWPELEAGEEGDGDE